eukprot:187660-Prorocentrum_minimum.AAC.1
MSSKPHPAAEAYANRVSFWAGLEVPRADLQTALATHLQELLNSSSPFTNNKVVGVWTGGRTTTGQQVRRQGRGLRVFKGFRGQGLRRCCNGRRAIVATHRETPDRPTTLMNRKTSRPLACAPLRTSSGTEPPN